MYGAYTFDLPLVSLISNMMRSIILSCWYLGRSCADMMGISFALLYNTRALMPWFWRRRKVDDVLSWSKTCFPSLSWWWWRRAHFALAHHRASCFKASNFTTLNFIDAFSFTSSLASLCSFLLCRKIQNYISLFSASHNIWWRYDFSLSLFDMLCATDYISFQRQVITYVNTYMFHAS